MSKVSLEFVGNSVVLIYYMVYVAKLLIKGQGCRQTAKCHQSAQNGLSHFCYHICYRISSVIRWSFLEGSFFSFQNNPKTLDPSYKTNLDLWDCLGRVKLAL